MFVFPLHLVDVVRHLCHVFECLVQNTVPCLLLLKELQNILKKEADKFILTKKTDCDKVYKLFVNVNSDSDKN